jgi:hypothetical protein
MMTAKIETNAQRSVIIKTLTIAISVIAFTGLLFTSWQSGDWNLAEVVAGFTCGVLCFSYGFKAFGPDSELAGFILTLMLVPAVAVGVAMKFSIFTAVVFFMIFVTGYLTDSLVTHFDDLNSEANCTDN